MATNRNPCGRPVKFDYFLVLCLGFIKKVVNPGKYFVSGPKKTKNHLCYFCNALKNVI